MRTDPSNIDDSDCRDGKQDFTADYYKPNFKEDYDKPNFKIAEFEIVGTTPLVPTALRRIGPCFCVSKKEGDE